MQPLKQPSAQTFTNSELVPSLMDSILLENDLNLHAPCKLQLVCGYLSNCCDNEMHYSSKNDIRFGCNFLVSKVGSYP